jgi:hypothetical protein
MRIRGSDESLEGCVAAVARQLIDDFAERYRQTGVGPQAPDVADFREAFSSYIERGLMERELQILMRYGTYPEAMKIKVRLNALNGEIAKREAM